MLVSLTVSPIALIAFFSKRYDKTTSTGIIRAIDFCAHIATSNTYAKSYPNLGGPLRNPIPDSILLKSFENLFNILPNGVTSK